MLLTGSPKPTADMYRRMRAAFAGAFALLAPLAARAQGGLLSGVSPLCGSAGSCQLSDFFVVGNNVVKLILGLSGSVMLLMVIYGGFMWLTSGGSADRIEKGKKILVGSAVGLIIVFGAYTLIQFILGAIGVANVAEIFKRPFGK